MRLFILCLLMIAAPVSAAPSTYDVPDGFWLTKYAVSDYGAHWHLHLEVKPGKFLRAKKKTVAVFEDERGASVLPLDSMVGSDSYQQYSFKLRKRNAARVLKRIRKEGLVKALTQRDVIEPKMTEEIGVKLERLKAEEKAGGELLKRLSATKAVVEELIAHLEKTLKRYEDAEDRVLFNVVIEEVKK